MGEQPKFKGNGVAVWVYKDKNGNPYLSIKILDSINIKAFLNQPKKEENKQAEAEEVL